VDINSWKGRLTFGNFPGNSNDFCFFCGVSTRFRDTVFLYGASRWHSLDIPHSGEHLWTSDQTDAKTCTWQHTTLTRDKHPWPSATGTHNSSNRVAADQRLRPRDHWRRHMPNYPIKLYGQTRICL